MALRRLTRAIAVVAVIIMAATVCVPAAHADIIRGLADIIGGVLEVPRSTLVGTFTGFPILGTAFGALAGVVNGTGLVARGALELVGSAIPIALKLAPLIPVFL